MSGGGKGGGHSTSTSEVTTTTVPKYLQPYLTGLASRAQAESKNPYQAYGGQRNAGFTGDQQAAMGDIRGMQMPGQFDQASNMYGAQGNLGYGAATQGFGGAGMAQGMGMGQAALGANRGFGAADALGQRGQGVADQGAQNAFGTAGALGQRGRGIADQGARDAFGTAGALGQRGRGAVDQGTRDAFGAAGALGQRGRGAVDQGMQSVFGYSTPQEFGGEKARQYTNPFQQQVTDVALRQAREEATRQGNLANLSAAGRGTAGGTRQAVMDSMRNRDTATGLSDIQMRGGMQGYENAQQQFERDQKRRMGAAQLGSTMAGQGFGAMGQAGQQYGALTGQGYGAMGQAAGQYGALTGQGLGAMGQAGGQYGALTGQGFGAMGQAGGQYGALAGQGYNAFGQANQLLGQAGMQGLGQGAAGLGRMGQAQEASDFARYQAQMGIGDKQQAYNDRQLQTDYGDFLRQRDYGKENLNFYSGILRGLPNTMGSTAISYGAQPNLYGQGMAGATGLAGIYNTIQGGRG